MYFIYKITNLINNKIYIGVHGTNDPNDNYMGSSKVLKIAINKHGIKNFKKEILFGYEDEMSAYKKESEIVNEIFINRKDTYNLKLGGFGCPKGKNAYWYGIRGKNNPNYGLKRSNETLERKRIASIGENNGMFGRKLSKEHKEKIRQANLNKIVSEETKEKLRNRMLNDPISKRPEIAEKISNKRIEQNLVKFKCKYCEKEMDKSNLGRWHNENCKKREPKLPF